MKKYYQPKKVKKTIQSTILGQKYITDYGSGILIGWTFRDHLDHSTPYDWYACLKTGKYLVRLVHWTHFSDDYRRKII